MSNRLDRTQKLDLLQDCNDQHVPPKEFMGIFCKRCRNHNCVNAGWSESSWSDRMATQVSRLLKNPNFADPNDPRFENVRNLDFRELAEPIIINAGGDPWEVPQVHLVDPQRQTNRSVEVEQALRTLASARGKPVPEPPVQAQPPEPPPVQQVMTPPVVSQEPARPSPRHYVVDTPPSTASPPSPTRDINTPFPAEGMMLDGSPPIPPPSPAEAGDPWAPPPVTASKKVPVGARIRMGEEPKK